MAGLDVWECDQPSAFLLDEEDEPVMLGRPVTDELLQHLGNRPRPSESLRRSDGLHLVLEMFADNPGGITDPDEVEIMQAAFRPWSALDCGG